MSGSILKRRGMRRSDRCCPRNRRRQRRLWRIYRKSLKPEASSYGRTIYADGRYVGDIWCYGIHEEKEPDAMISYCIFEKALWGRGAATEALRMFLELIAEKFRVRTVGGFTFAENQASIRVMEKERISAERMFC